MFLQSIPFLGYPPTAHIAGSRLQFGDSAKDQTPLTSIAGKWGVIEEKLDGANAGLSFGEGGDLRLQSRGHYLLGGWNERQFALFKTWARAHEDRLLALLEDRYTLFGEWLHAKHSIWYDCLPHLLAEFDIWDRSRRSLLWGGHSWMPCIQTAKTRTYRFAWPPGVAPANPPNQPSIATSGPSTASRCASLPTEHSPARCVQIPVSQLVLIT